MQNNRNLKSETVEAIARTLYERDPINQKDPWDKIPDQWKAGYRGDAKVLYPFVLIEREECAKIADNAMLVPPDGGSPNADEIEMCERIARFIRARGETPWQPK